MKTLQNIADEAFDDLLVLREKFNDLKYMLRAVHQLLPEHDTAGRLAKFAAIHAEEWETHVEEWGRAMEANLSALDSQTSAAPQKPSSRNRGAGGAA
ncbi:hypothetical protein [Pseudomonas sp. NBRC 111131]|uniref:hypothetical protein n=1 Tax=Pseudomonas sp. NBRC 111131 TaxID=1661046 RepID=UPI0006D40F81|nr:hypothetical protein [Pseudomonas sp. NBRC 111131]